MNVRHISGSLLLLNAFTLSAMSCVSGEETDTLQSSLLNNNLVNDDDSPWLVRISNNAGGACNGTIINRRWILTAAHCLSGYLSANVFWSKTDHVTGRAISGSQMQASIFVHPAYSLTLYGGENDIALIRLSAALDEDPLLTPADLPSRPLINTQQLSIFSTTDNDEILPPAKVSQVYAMFQVGSCNLGPASQCLNLGTSRACESDSGTGVMSGAVGTRQASGIVSAIAPVAGSSCGASGNITFADTIQYLDWVTKTISAHTTFDNSGFKGAVSQLYPGLDFGLPSSWDLAAADFDGDGRADYARLGSTGAWLYFGTQSGDFTQGFQDYSAQGLAFGTPSTYQTIVGDFNGDRIWDYVRVGGTGAWFFFGHANRAFTASFQSYAGLDFGSPSSWQTFAGDFNGDGRSDYIRLGSTGAWVFYGSTAGTITRAFQAYPSSFNFGLPSPWQPVAGDFNGDGKQDYARLGDAGAWVYLGTSTMGVFTQIFQAYSGLNFGLPSSSEPIAGDFDGDGRTDYARLTGTGAFVFFGTTSGSFTQTFQTYQGLDFGTPSSWKTITGDFNGDGRRDYARLGDTGAYIYSGATSRTFTVLFQAYQRHFGIPSEFQTTSGDFNGDGRTDYVRLGGVFHDAFIHN